MFFFVNDFVMFELTPVLIGDVTLAASTSTKARSSMRGRRQSKARTTTESKSSASTLNGMPLLLGSCIAC